MKRAGLHSKRKYKQAYKKLGVTKQVIDHAVKITTDYLKNWTTKEIKRLALQENVPVFLPIGNHGYFIGRFRLNLLEANCYEVLDHNNELIHQFCRKQSAIFYCIARQANKSQIADKLLKIDVNVGKLESDRKYYEIARIKSSKKKDYFKVDLLTARSFDTELKLNEAIQELEKTINIAKYLQV